MKTTALSKPVLSALAIAAFGAMLVMTAASAADRGSVDEGGRFDPFNPRSLDTAGSLAQPQSLGRPPIRVPYRPPLRSPFRPPFGPPGS